MGGLGATEELTGRIIAAAMQVHSALGPGLLESVYELCLAAELRANGMTVEQQRVVPLRYRDLLLDAGFRLDLVVDESVIVELKSVQSLDAVHYSQTRTYLKLSGYRVALLLNFNTTHLRDGIRRFTPEKQETPVTPLLPSSP